MFRQKQIDVRIGHCSEGFSSELKGFLRTCVSINSIFSYGSLFRTLETLIQRSLLRELIDPRVQYSLTFFSENEGCFSENQQINSFFLK